MTYVACLIDSQLYLGIGIHQCLNFLVNKGYKNCWLRMKSDALLRLISTLKLFGATSLFAMRTFWPMLQLKSQKREILIRKTLSIKLTLIIFVPDKQPQLQQLRTSTSLLLMPADSRPSLIKIVGPHVNGDKITPILQDVQNPFLERFDLFHAHAWHMQLQSKKNWHS